jgi:hypothetical protein
MGTKLLRIKTQKGNLGYLLHFTSKINFLLLCYCFRIKDLTLEPAEGAGMHAYV